MKYKPPLSIPGTPIRDPDQPSSKKCPYCKRTFTRAKIKQVGNKRILTCPYCGKEYKHPQN